MHASIPFKDYDDDSHLIVLVLSFLVYIFSSLSIFKMLIVEIDKMFINGKSVNLHVCGNAINEFIRIRATMPKYSIIFNPFFAKVTEEKPTTHYQTPLVTFSTTVTTIFLFC